ncbi:MAG: hypothetical protein P8N43_03785 [Alphaproteobacteria bacterium]|nr:hypothetical protein [Alphaproteobacteria bacterium]
MKKLKFSVPGLKRVFLVPIVPFIMCWSVPLQAEVTPPGVPTILGMVDSCWYQIEKTATEKGDADYFYYHSDKLWEIGNKIGIYSVNSENQMVINEDAEHYATYLKAYNGLSSKSDEDKEFSCLFMGIYLYVFSVGYDFGTTGNLGELHLD